MVQTLLRTITGVAFAMVVATAASGCHRLGGAQLSLMPELVPADELVPGDRIRVVVFQQQDLSGDFTLDDEARLDLPLVGQLSTQGLTTDALRQAIVDALEPDYLRDPQVTVQRISQRPIYLLGEVRNPGRYEHSETLSVAKAVALAGGLTYRASTRRISIRRVDVDGSVIEFRVDMNAPVLGGDLILVSERYF